MIDARMSAMRAQKRQPPVEPPPPDRKRTPPDIRDPNPDKPVSDPPDPAHPPRPIEEPPRKSWFKLPTKPMMASKIEIPVTSGATALLLFALLAGCAQPSLRPGAHDPSQVTRSINLSGFPPEYKRGFGAGCADAKAASGRPAQRPKANAAYVRGWVDGAHYCSPREAR